MKFFWKDAEEYSSMPKRRKKKGETMRLLIVRHGDPDYTIDSLTECSCYIEKQ